MKKLIIACIICLIIGTVATANETLPVGNHYFTADWCGPCQQQSVIIKKLQKQGFDIQIYNWDNDPKIFDELDIKAVPFIIIVKINEKGKQIILKLKGKQPLRKLIKLLIKITD